MEKYKTIKKLGSGAFGHVEKAQNTETKEIVAIKKLKKKYSTWDQCLQLAQVKALRKLMHPNIIKLKEVVRLNNEAYFIFEYIDKDLYKFCQERKEKGKSLQEQEIKTIMYQVALALAYMHKQGFFHRDLKPENLLLSQDNVVKIIDFGLAKQIRSKPPFTEYVSTRWYRAPEILLKSFTYSAPVDVFAFGCVLAELYLMKPLFMGASEIDQLNKICSVLGTPTAADWADGLKLANQKGYNFPQYSALALASIFPNCSSEGLSLIAECLRFDPSKRITMAQILNHPYFKDTKPIKVSEQTTNVISPFQRLSINNSNNHNNNNNVSQSPPSKPRQISEHEFDELLNNLSVGKKQKQVPGIQKRQQQPQQSSEQYTGYVPSNVSNSNNTFAYKETASELPKFGYSLATKIETDLDKDSRYGGYMPSFGGSNKDRETDRKKKGTLGMFGLESIKR